MWEILTAQTKEEIYYSFECYGLFPEEQKGCRKRIRAIDVQLYIDQHILKEVKTRQKNVAIAWIDDKKAYDMVPQTCKIECPKMCKMSDNFITKAMKNWKMELAAGGQTLHR